MANEVVISGAARTPMRLKLRPLEEPSKTVIWSRPGQTSKLSDESGSTGRCATLTAMTLKLAITNGNQSAKAIFN